MEFPDDDPYWTSTAEFLHAHRRGSDRLVAPAEFAERLPGVLPATHWLAACATDVDWVVVNKAGLDQFDVRFLVETTNTLRAAYANEVFVVFAADGRGTPLPPENVHVDALHVALRAVLSTWRPGVVPAFALQ